ERVGELQTVSGLAPVVEELQTVSGLAPYVQAILGSRIVDHNLDVANPPNGWYVRWENGLQACVRVVGSLALNMQTQARQNLTIYYDNTISWTCPAAFVSPPFAMLTGDITGRGYLESFVTYNTSSTNTNFAVEALMQSNTLDYASMFAIGGWK